MIDLRREDFPLDQNHAAFFSHINDMVGQNRASTIQIRSFVREIEAFVGEIEAIDQDINRRREHRREQYRAQEAQLIQDNRAQEARLIQDNRARLEADERELDAESDERLLRLRTHCESVFDLARFGQDASHQAPVAGGNFHHSLLSVRLPSMDVDHNTDEAFLDSVERQTLSSTAIGESHADAVPANMVPPHADETPGVASATVLPSNGARNGPNSQFERSPDSGYGSSHTLCMGCDT